MTQFLGSTVGEGLKKARLSQRASRARPRFGGMLIFFIGIATAVAGGDGWKIAGSDLLGANFSEEAKLFSTRIKTPVSLALHGSRDGLEALKRGDADVAILAFAPDETPPGAPFVSQPLAYRIAVAVVPERIGVTQITFTELDGFFGVEGPAGYTLWRDLGVTGGVGSLTVGTHVLASDDAALSLQLFTHRALRAPKLRPSVQRHSTFAELESRLAAEEGGIAILASLPVEGSGLRALMVSTAAGEPAFGATPENIHTGDYPLRMPVYVVYRSADAAKLRDLLVFLWSDDVARALGKNGLWVPVPASGRPAL